MNKAHAALIVAIVVAMIFGFAVQPAKSQSNHTVYLAIVMRNSELSEYNYIPPAEPRHWVTSCGADPARGQIYRNLVTSTTTILLPLGEWSAASCDCGMSTARQFGYSFGYLVALAMNVILAVIGLVFDGLAAAVSLLSSIFQLARGAGTPPAINCAGDTAAICWGIAAIAALDDWAGGLITIIVLLLVAILSFYLGMFIVNNVREMLQPGSGAGGGE